jgi:carboxymethylenebutenolidase
MHLGEEDEFISKTARAQIKAALAKKPNATVYSYRTTTVEQANF